jgi:2-aminoadipate transaminase
VAAELAAQGLQADAGRVLITSGSQQGLDLVAKVLIDPGSRVAVESPTYLGALQAFAPYEPLFDTLEGDDEGPLPASLAAVAGVRFAYLLPNFQNPSGRCLGAARREALADAALAAGVPVVEDNPYCELWYDAPPPPPLAARLGEQAVVLGSFSKVLAPGLRLGYLLSPPALFNKLLQAKQAADLHTPTFNQRLVHTVLASGMLPAHVAAIRERYRVQRDAMAAALAAHMPAGVRWQVPAGGMFFWLTLPEGVDATALLPRAVAAGVAYVPGSTFFPQGGHPNTLRLSFVTVPAARIAEGVAALARVLGTA